MSMRHIVIFGLSGSTICFHFISSMARIWKKKFTEHKIGVLIFPTTLTETFLIMRRTERDRIKIQIGVYVHYLSSLPDFNETFIFSINFRNNSKNPLGEVVPRRQT